jgi:hypothetical protein
MVQAAIFVALMAVTAGLIYEIHGPKERRRPGPDQALIGHDDDDLGPR